MATSMTLIASSTVGVGGAASIDFTSIPSTYTDLVLKSSIRGTTAATYIDVNVAFNGSTSSMTRRFIYGDGSAAASGADPNSRWIYTDAANATASTFANSEIYIPNYAGSTNKSISADTVTENNLSSGIIQILVAGLWSNTAAINQITLTVISGNWAQYSTAYLYGIKNS
jgi:hypothetical protein